MRVAVLLGGISREREVSLVSGEAVALALEGRGHEVVRFVVNDESLAGLAAARPDVAFVALHGRFGEDGGVQRACAALGIPYTGSGPEASRRAMNKDISKRAFAEAGLAVPEAVRFDPPLDAGAVAEAVARVVGWPCVVKPVAEGSSIGVSIVSDAAALGPALEAVAALGGAALVERFIAGREFTVGVLGDAALPPIELVPRRAFYDYAAKYDADSGTEYRVDPPLEPALRAALLDAARRAHAALGCEAYSRVDLRVDGAGRPFVLEVNTIPGMTPRSLLPKAAAAAGIAFDVLCERLCEDGIARRGARRGEDAGRARRAEGSGVAA